MNAGLTGVSWLDWKLGARLLLKYPALTIIGGLSLAGAIAIGAVGIEVAGELLYTRLPFPEGGRVVRLETQDTAASRVEPRVLHDFAIWRRSLKTVTELGAARVELLLLVRGQELAEELDPSAAPALEVVLEPVHDLGHVQDVLLQADAHGAVQELAGLVVVHEIHGRTLAIGGREGREIRLHEMPVDAHVSRASRFHVQVRTPLINEVAQEIVDRCHRFGASRDLSVTLQHRHVSWPD